MNTGYQIPGYLAPGAPKEEQILHFDLNGNAKVLLVTLAKDAAMPPYEVELLLDYGKTKTQVLYDDRQISLFAEVADAGKNIYFGINSDVYRIDPGTYVLRLSLNGTTILEKFLVVPYQPVTTECTVHVS